MLKKELKIITGILTVLIFISSGTVYYIVDSGTKTSCKAGFEYAEMGEFEGYYSCTTLSGKRYEMCFEVYNSSNTENYWCRKGILVEQKEIPKESLQLSSGSGNIHCTYKACF